MMRRVAGMAGLIAGAALAVMAAAGPVVAQDAKTTIEARKALMKEVGANNAEITKFVRGESRESIADIGKRGETMAELARKAQDAFKAKTDAVPGVETAAKPEIWTDWAKFSELLANLEKAASGVAAAAASGSADAVKTAAGEVGKTCGACHSTFRVRRS